MTSALDGSGWSASRPGRLYPRESPGTHCTEGWVGLRAGLEGCGKPRLAGIRSPDRPARSELLYRLALRRGEWINSLPGRLLPPGTKTAAN